MDVVEGLLEILHFVGLASLLGGFLVQMSASQKTVNPAMLHGALTQLVTGLALVGLAEAVGEDELNHAKIGVKLLVLVVVMALVLVGRRKETVSTGFWAAIGALTLTNVAVAVLW